MDKFVLSIDQSTQGTKALLFNQSGKLVARKDLPHKQIIDSNGWVSHDPEEIYRNLIAAVAALLAETGIGSEQIVCLGISNQRETTVSWEKETGRPVCNAIVWQCARAAELCDRIAGEADAEMIRKATGIPLSPYFPASKMAWILENVSKARELAKQGRLCFGTVDTWLLYKLTKGRSYKTDYSNASRTQLFNINTLQWDPWVCGLFGIDPMALAEVCDSDSLFGYTDLEGLLPQAVPICGVLGDSHAALFGQGCLTPGTVKATYGTGTSVMMNIGAEPRFSRNGLVTSLAWKFRGEAPYVMEGNLNYTGAVISWLKNDMALLETPAETEQLARQANPEDTTYLVPAFTGLGAPYWKNDSKAIVYGMSRLTGRAEFVKAGLESIAYQITDVLKAMERDAGARVKELCVDGGATRNGYLMQFQSDILSSRVLVPDAEELSGIGAAYMAGLTAGVFDLSVFDLLNRRQYDSFMDETTRQDKLNGWRNAVQKIL